MFLEYLALVLGIFVQPCLANYQKTGAWSLAGWSGWAIFAIIVGLLIFPAAYNNAFAPTKPLFVQLCAIFAAGVGWQSLFETVGKPLGLTA